MLVPQFTSRRLAWVASACLLLLGLLIWLVVRHFSPAPPNTLTITTGAVEGASHQFGLRYQQIMKTHGVRLELLPSSGGVQNLERLNAGTPSGFVQGGLGILSLDPLQEADSTPLRSLAVIGYEPLWIFTQSGALAQSLPKSLASLRGKRVSLGAQGSGTRKVALELLAAYGIDDTNTTLLPDAGMAAAQKLIAKDLDVVILISAPQAKAVQTLLEHPGVKLASLEHAEGLARRFPYLSLVSLKAASVFPQKNIPAEDVTLLATTANLVVRDELHPALAYLLLDAAREVHKGASLLSRPGEFPHPRGTDFPLADEAARYYKDGRPFLQRYLPYWAANFVQRLLLILIPLLAVAIPVLKAIPSLLEWRQKNNLFRRYGVLLDLERALREKQLSPEQLQRATVQLDDIEKDISASKFSVEFSDRIYTLRQHVDYVRAQLRAHSQALSSNHTEHVNS